MKKAILILLIFVCSKAIAQDFMSSFPIQMTKKMVAFSYVDQQIDNSYCFVGNKTNVKAMHFDSNFKIVDTLLIARPNDTFENIAGCNKNETALNLFWINEKSTEICCQSINFKDKKTAVSYSKLNVEKQKILQSFSTNEKLYLLSIKEKSSTLVFNIIDNKGIVTEKTIDLSKTNFHLSTQEIGSLYDVFKESFKPYESSFELPIINLEAPISLSVTSKKRKCYFKENQLIITLDSDINATQIIKINLTDFSYESNSIYSSVAISEKSNSNSLLIDNNLLRLDVSEEDMNFTIFDLKGNIVKNYAVEKKDKISFMSSEFKTEFVNSGYGKKVNSTERFFDELSYLNVGICSYKIKDKNLITIGGVSNHVKKIDYEDPNRYVFSQFGLVGALLYMAFKNQEQVCYDFSKNFCYFYSLLDNKYEMQSESFISYPLESIKNFFNSNTNAALPTLITTEKSHFLGFYNTKNSEYSFLKYNK